MDETIIPEDAAFRIHLPSFEGPLDLLLHLIKTHELDILDLPISFVTERYLEYLHMMQELDLDVASEYLLMAATLAHIKSKMLLPQNPLEEAEEADEGYQEDPRAQLIRRLLEYQKYRLAAEQLGSRPIAGRDVFGRGVKAPEAQGPAPLASIDLYKLLDAFQGILKRVKGRAALEVTAEAITIQERISQLSDLLRQRRMCTFTELFEGDRTRYEVVVTFLALLEMTKLRMTRIYQVDPASPLHIQFALLDADAIPPEGEAAEDGAEAEGGLAADALLSDEELDVIEHARVLTDEGEFADESNTEEELPPDELAAGAQTDALDEEELAALADAALDEQASVLVEADSDEASAPTLDVPSLKSPADVADETLAEPTRTFGEELGPDTEIIPTASAITELLAPITGPDVTLHERSPAAPGGMSDGQDDQDEYDSPSDDPASSVVASDHGASIAAIFTSEASGELERGDLEHPSLEERAGPVLSEDELTAIETAETLARPTSEPGAQPGHEANSAPHDEAGPSGSERAARDPADEEDEAPP